MSRLSVITIENPPNDATNSPIRPKYEGMITRSRRSRFIWKTDCTFEVYSSSYRLIVVLRRVVETAHSSLLKRVISWNLLFSFKFAEQIIIQFLSAFTRDEKLEWMCAHRLLGGMIN